METSYKNMKPGLARRLAYSKQLRSSVYQEPMEIEFVIQQDFFVDTLTLLTYNTKVILNNDTTNFCNICQEFVSKNKLIRILSCGHIYHIKCIMFHTATSDTCPTCRSNIFFNT